MEKKNWDWKARYTTYLTIRDHVTVVHASVTSIECGRHVGNYYVTIRLKRWSFSFLSSSINHTISITISLLSLSFSTYIYICICILLIVLIIVPGWFVWLIYLTHAHTLSLSLFLSCYVIYDQNILWIVNVIKICVFSFFFYFIYISLYIEII